MTTGKIIALTRWTLVDKVMSLLFNMLSRLAITFQTHKKWHYIFYKDTCKFEARSHDRIVIYGGEGSGSE